VICPGTKQYPISSFLNRAFVIQRVLFAQVVIGLLELAGTRAQMPGDNIRADTEEVLFLTSSLDAGPDILSRPVLVWSTKADVSSRPTEDIRLCLSRVT